MFHDRSLARLLPTFALAALGLCFAQGASAFPEDMFDPGAPPSDFPDHSGDLFNFGSTFIFSFSRGAGNFVPNAVVNCTTCKFPVDPAIAHTFTLTGRVLGQVRNNNGTVDELSTGVYRINVQITGVRATVSPPVPVGDGTSEQTIRYAADLGAASPFNAVLSGTLVLDSQEGEPMPAGLVNGATISLGAAAGATQDLILGVTFPAVPANSPQGLGQAVPANVVFQVAEKKRLRLP